MKNVVRIKEFKITGVISNEKNPMSYASLNKQIESAIERGYPEREIIDGIINAVSPSLHLKSYLESIKSLSLAQLRQILRSHYCENDTLTDIPSPELRTHWRVSEGTVSLPYWIKAKPIIKGLCEKNTNI